jgi:hypothetical protein
MSFTCGSFARARITSRRNSIPSNHQWPKQLRVERRAADAGPPGLGVVAGEDVLHDAHEVLRVLVDGSLRVGGGVGLLGVERDVVPGDAVVAQAGGVAVLAVELEVSAGAG